MSRQKAALCRVLVIAGALTLTACGAVTTVVQRVPVPGPTVTRTITRTVIKPVLVTPSATPEASAPDNTAVVLYPAWSAPGETVPSWLQPSTPSVNGATRFTIVNCSAYQCTGYPGAGPDGSTCGPVTSGEQVCVA